MSILHDAPFFQNEVRNLESMVWSMPEVGAVMWFEEFSWGGSKDLMQEKSEEGCAMIEIRSEGWVYGLCSNITLNMWDMRSKFGYTMISKIRTAFGRRFARSFFLPGDGTISPDRLIYSLPLKNFGYLCGMWFRFTAPKGCASQPPSQTLLPIGRN